MRKKKNKITSGGNFTRQGQTASTITLTQPKRFNIDISDYTNAVRQAENVDFSLRTKLYDLYADILMDTHLTSVTEKRKNAILFTPITFKRNGVVDERIDEQLKSPWFYKFLSDVWDSQLWGFSFFQFYMEGEWMKCDLIPRKHVDPVKRIIKKRQEDITGESWDEFDDTLFVGNPDDLGKLAKSAPWVIYKRNTIADEAQFSEVFGMPIREYVYETDDDEARKRAIEDAENSGGSAVIIHSKESSLKLIESGNKSGSADVYETLTNRCNAELSKQYLGNTLTTESGKNGTQALGTVQKEGEEMVNKADERLIIDILNYEMTDIFANFGFDVRGGRFEFEKSQQVDANKLIEIIGKLHQMGLPISFDYLYETFGIDKPENLNELIKMLETKPEKELEPETKEEPQPEPTAKGKRNFINRFFDFFGGALGKGAALKW
ncbi:phage portal protein family protein [Viscerimonas tarda]